MNPYLFITLMYFYLQGCHSLLASPIINPPIIHSQDPMIISLPNLIQNNEINSINSIITKSSLDITRNYQEDVFSANAYEQEDLLFHQISKPFMKDIPLEYRKSPMQMFVHVATKYQDELDENDIIKGANAIQRRQAMERWKSNDGRAILELSDDDGFESIGKRYQMPKELISDLEITLIPKLLKGKWELKDATIVHYEDGDSQVPHLDPCDATILVCLENNTDRGDTCFPLLNLRVQNKKGNGILFFSSDLQANDDGRERNAMSLHHGGMVKGGEKVVFQLMLDFIGDYNVNNSWLDLIACM